MQAKAREPSNQLYVTVGHQALREAADLLPDIA
jgi:hypothetical protein